MLQDLHACNAVKIMHCGNFFALIRTCMLYEMQMLQNLHAWNAAKSIRRCNFLAK